MSELGTGDGWRADGPLRRLIDDNFVRYAAYVIRDRAIPDLADGLKPVQRRILHALHEIDDGSFVKVANVVGHAMQYHPHGDVSIAEALVALANKELVIERQGNFGNVLTGDPAAASRYIECRLTPLARRELFNDELTRFAPSYDGRRREPLALPSKLPLLLMLGAEGIAVGLSTRILPHNPREVLEAQIAWLRGEPFELVPDFVQGGLMDAAEYADGTGRVRVRTRIETADDGASVVIRSVPPGVTTESLIGSIEAAAKKKKLAIRSIDDFTAGSVEIRVALAAGRSAETTVQALYAFTQCEVALSSRVVVIRRDRPVEMAVSEVVAAATKRLLALLRRELETERRRLLDEIHLKTLVQIFVEEKVYRAIERCETAEAVERAVLDGVSAHRARLERDVSGADVERLLAIKIKRISQHDVERNRAQIDAARGAIEIVERRLGDLKAHAVRELRRILRTYGDGWTRRTEVASFTAVAVRELTADELTLGYDAERGYLGHGVRGDARLVCSSLDRVLIVRGDGRYEVGPPPEKLFVDRGLAWCGLHERDERFVAVWVDEDGLAHVRRFRFGGAVAGREYRLAPPGASVTLVAAGDPTTLWARFGDGGGQAFDLSALRLGTPKSRARVLTSKRVVSVAAERPADWSERRFGRPRPPLDR